MNAPATACRGDDALTRAAREAARRAPALTDDQVARVVSLLSLAPQTGEGKR